ncbi:MAG: SpoIIE family protein phosphatase [Myxococcota bacterium]|jgi:hypothetical protein|nr:SpoIIE family protein phosphatase [Myxococcota bacterium]
MAYLHMELSLHASAKHSGEPSGDVVELRRKPDFSWLVLADGLGHGVRAHVAATLHLSRLLGLLEREFSFREAFLTVASGIHAQRGQDLPFATLLAARVRSDGELTVLSYDAPEPIFVGRHAAMVLPGRAFSSGAALVQESNGFLAAGEGLLLLSDGVTQAGLGRGLVRGWTAEGVARELSDALSEGMKVADAARRVHEQARKLWSMSKRPARLSSSGGPDRLHSFALGHRPLDSGKSFGLSRECVPFAHFPLPAPWSAQGSGELRATRQPSQLGDDVTAALLYARPGRTLTILTGPPSSRQDDSALVHRFLEKSGMKVVCGASTAQMVARFLGTTLRVEQGGASAIAPPRYYLEGIELVTEGAVTLNQVYNILDEAPERFEPDSPVSELALALLEADRVDFLGGRAPNLGANDIAFQQQGILPRSKIVPLLEEALQRRQKLVTCVWC